MDSDNCSELNSDNSFGNALTYETDVNELDVLCEFEPQPQEDPLLSETESLVGTLDNADVDSRLLNEIDFVVEGAPDSADVQGVTAAQTAESDIPQHIFPIRSAPDSYTNSLFLLSTTPELNPQMWRWFSLYSCCVKHHITHDAYRELVKTGIVDKTVFPSTMANKVSFCVLLTERNNISLHFIGLQAFRPREK